MFSFSKLTPNAAVAASVQLRGSVAHLLPEAEPRLTELLKSIETKTVTLQSAINKKRGGILTDQIYHTEKAFKLHFGLFCESMEMLLKEMSIEGRGRVISNPAGVAAAAIIDYMGDLKSLTTLARPAQMGAFKSLKTGLESPERQQFIADAGAADRYLKVCESFTKLETVVLESAQLESEQNLIPTSTDAKFDLVRYLRRLYDFVHTFAEIGNSDYLTPASEMDEILEKFRPMMNQKHEHGDDVDEFCEEDHCSDHETESEEDLGLE